ncbi:Thiosulfate dehydrogenase [Neobacillus rhizosphaerae]|uniref:Thiosulfate dehydrogenase n=1 Tax=Neobacillus rhizosphaerae TaxID=2880965 RepID=A0ABN8KKG0_9BACI|nr:c-type cytochrome [Neobacillus rhizosphaerae]CAH2713744.1 Thiosulfate dehydrogenase [Neobacillus rhizosphaerae]
MFKLKKMKIGYGLPLLATALLLSGCGSDKPAATDKPKENQATSGEQTAMKTYEPPSMEKVPEGPLGESIKLGFKLMNETNTALPNNVGDNLACSSCHGTGGTDSTSPLTGVTAVYPAYNPRAGTVMTIEDRINGCFKRSMNGKPLQANSDEMRAMVAYLTYISTDVPIGIKERPWVIKNSLQNLPTPNLANGEKLYQQSCSTCHGADGSGTGPTSGPALWGSKSFNIGAGMGRISTAAGYIKRNMPLGEMGGIKQGSLTDQQAADLAGFILSKDRPDFADKVNDWPLGNAPADVPYELKSSKK